MYTVRDGALAAWHSASASEMGCRLTCRAAPQRRSRGSQSDTLTGMAARPAERRCLGAPTPDLAGKEPGIPSTHARGQGGAGWGEAGLRYPARHGGQAGQASGGRRRRPSRAFFAPRALRSEANGREPGRPAPPSIASGGSAAARMETFRVSSALEQAAALTPPLFPCCRSAWQDRRCVRKGSRQPHSATDAPRSASPRASSAPRRRCRA